MKIVADENIAYAKYAFSEFGEVILLSGRDINNKILIDADALITRSITIVNEALLKGTKIKFVGTATIGIDHIDLEYLNENGITFASAAGCNSFAVVEYVLAGISRINFTNNKSFENKTIGVIGLGNIGSKLAKICESLGFEVIKNDPPLQRLTGSKEYSTLNDALSADIVTLHVPLNLSGIDKSYQLINSQNISKIKNGALLINTSRGPVVDNNSLLMRLTERVDLSTILDVWENEPNIVPDLLKLVDIGTAHIAGYSLEGKVNGTVMIYEALCKFINKKMEWRPVFPTIENNSIKITNNKSIEAILNTIFNHVYPIREDHQLLNKLLKLNVEDRGQYFDGLRKNYRLRRELNNYEVILQNDDERFISILRKLRLKI